MSKLDEMIERAVMQRLEGQLPARIDAAIDAALAKALGTETAAAAPAITVNVASDVDPERVASSVAAAVKARPAPAAAKSGRAPKRGGSKRKAARTTPATDPGGTIGERILAALATGPLSVVALAEKVPCDSAARHQALRRLTAAAKVAATGAGKEKVYGLSARPQAAPGE